MLNDKKKSLSVSEKKEIFLALVKAQDLKKMTVPATRKAVAEEFGISEKHVKDIEEEGLDAEWPPLGD